MKRHIGLVMAMMAAFSIAGCAADDIKEEESQTVQPEEVSEPAQVLEAGEMVKIDGVCEFSVDYVTITEEPELFYKADADKTYVDFCITYNHFANYTMTADHVMEGKLIYSGLYEYEGTGIVADKNGDSWSYAHTEEIRPLVTREVHYLFNVPKEVQESGRMVELNFQIGGNDYLVVVREGEKGAVADSGNGSAKTSGAITDGEVVVTENSEFYVEYAQFAETVKPPQPRDSGYNYFTADDGNVYIDFCIVYRNLSTQSITAYDAVSAKLEQANATASVAEESGRSMFDYANIVKIIPLCTGYVHYIFQVPEELETGSEEVTISLKIDGNKYTYSVK